MMPPTEEPERRCPTCGQPVPPTEPYMPYVPYSPYLRPRIVIVPTEPVVTPSPNPPHWPIAII